MGKTADGTAPSCWGGRNAARHSQVFASQTRTVESLEPETICVGEDGEDGCGRRKGLSTQRVGPRRSSCHGFASAAARRANAPPLPLAFTYIGHQSSAAHREGSGIRQGAVMLAWLPSGE